MRTFAGHFSLDKDDVLFHVLLNKRSIENEDVAFLGTVEEKEMTMMIVRNVESPEAQRTTYMAHGGGMARMLLTREFMQGIEFFAWGVLPPGRALEEHVDPVEEIYFILAGSGRMKVGDEEREVKMWDAIWIPAGERHGLTNDGDENVFTVVVAAYPRQGRSSCPLSGAR